MEADVDVNAAAGKQFSMERVVKSFRRIFSPRKEVQEQSGEEGVHSVQQVGGVEQGFDEFVTEEGELSFDQETGTEKPANGRLKVFYDKMQDYKGEEQSAWFLAPVTERVTKKQTSCPDEGCCQCRGQGCH